MQKHFLSKHIIFFQLLGLTFYDAIVSLTRQSQNYRVKYVLIFPRDTTLVGNWDRSPISDRYGIKFSRTNLIEIRLNRIKICTFDLF